MNTQLPYEVLAETPDELSKPFFLYAVKRLSDGRIIQVGDTVEEMGTGRIGQVYSIRGGMKAETLFIYTDKTEENGIRLENVIVYKNVAFKNTTGDHVEWLGHPCVILAVHGYPGKLKYDIEIKVSETEVTRVYNVDSKYTKLVKE